jgi:hypothetical protein
MSDDRFIVLGIITGLLIIFGGIGGCAVHESNRTFTESKVIYGTGGNKISEERKSITYPIKKYLDEEKRMEKLNK